jgi:hypothetical protein
MRIRQYDGPIGWHVPNPQEEPMTAAVHQEHAGHEHVHGEGCGHVAFPHADHVDYVHGGHIHRAHDAHYDEH